MDRAIDSFVTSGSRLPALFGKHLLLAKLATGGMGEVFLARLTSAAGFEGPSTPHGNEEDPFNPLVLMLEAGATFVARGYSARVEELAGIIASAVEHEGFSLVEVLQPSVTYTNYYEKYEKMVQPIDTPASSLDDALKLAREQNRLVSGILYRVDRPSHGKRLYGDLSPVAAHQGREDRLGKVKSLIEL